MVEVLSGTWLMPGSQHSSRRFFDNGLLMAIHHPEVRQFYRVGVCFALVRSPLGRVVGLMSNVTQAPSCDYIPVFGRFQPFWHKIRASGRILAVKGFLLELQPLGPL